MPVTVRVVRGAGRAWAAQAHMVVGMSSMLLVESARMGVPVVSLQLGRETPSPVIADKAGIRIARREEEVQVALLEVAQGGPRASARPPVDDTERFVALIRSMAGHLGEKKRSRWAQERAVRVREGWMEQRAKIDKLRSRASRLGGIVARLAGDRAGDILGALGMETPWITSCYSAIDQWLKAAATATPTEMETVAVAMAVPALNVRRTDTTVQLGNGESFSGSINGTWQNKIAAGFTNSGAKSGDKLQTLMSLAVFAAQHHMLWVSLGLPPGWNSSTGSDQDLNRLGFWLGAAAATDVDAGPEHVHSADVATCRHLGARVSAVCRQLIAGRAVTAAARGPAASWEPVR